MEKVRGLETLEQKRVLVTGANGFVGQALTSYLADSGFDVYALERYVSNRYNAPSNRRAKTVFADLTDHLAINCIVRQVKPEIIIHLAALSPVAASYDRWQEYLETNFNATVNLAETALRDDPNLQQFVMAATSECYGNQDTLPISEEAVYHPTSPYAVAKVAAVHYLQYMRKAYNFPVTIMFPFNSYGRRECRHFIVERLIWQMLTQKTVRLGNPEPVRDFLHINDHILGYASVLGKEEAHGESFNLCTGKGTSIKELASKIARLTRFNGEIEWGTIPTRPIDIDALVGDNTKAQKLLGWKPQVTLDAGLQKTVEMLRNDT